MEDLEKNGFESFGFNKQILEAIKAQNWSTPTPIQEKAIPVIKSGKDVLGIAQTGTGKTAAFLLPLIHKLRYPQGQHTRALILAPTKELVFQLYSQFEALNIHLHLRGITLVGGVGISAQLKQLLEGNDLVFATPGRFMEIYRSGEWKVKEIKTLVIDEADRMMDMGFMPQIRKILEVLPSKRQNMLFSATFSPTVDRLASEFLEFPERLEASPPATVAETIDQMAYKVPNFQSKLLLLHHHLMQLAPDESALVFVKTRKNAVEIGKYLNRKLPSEVGFLHANKGTNARLATLDALRESKQQVLVATDVAARGLDVTSVSLVVNVDLPIKYEEFVHRVGRTGRAGRKGLAISFIDPADELHLERIEKLIGKKIPVLDTPEGIRFPDTPFEESQAMLRKLDEQRKKADPDFKGAFHEKKKPKKSTRKPGQKAKGKPTASKRKGRKL